MKKDKHMIMSIPLTFVPYFNRNDGTRMQMAASQMRQSLNLLNGESPQVETGNESLFLEYSNTYITSSVNAHVIYVDRKFILLYNTNKQFDIIYLDKKQYYDIKVKVGDSIKVGDLLAVVVDKDNESVNVISGVNLKTAIQIYHGLNYEDSIPISKSAAAKLIHNEIIEKDIIIKKHQIALSLEQDIYKPFLNVGDEIKIGQPLSIIKNANLQCVHELLKPPKEIVSDYNGTIIDIKYYINEWNVETRELHIYLNKIIKQNDEKDKKIFDTIIENLYNITGKKLKYGEIPSYVKLQIRNILGTRPKTNYKYKNDYIDTIVKYKILSKNKINNGDKLANRHGNKGTISIVMDDDLILQTKDGPVDIVINTLGIPGRMNIGQIFELYSANILLNVKKECFKLIENKKLEEAKKYIKTFYNDIDCTEDKYIINCFNLIVDDIKTLDECKSLVKHMTFIAPTFENLDIKDLKKLCEKYGVEDKQTVYDPMIDHYKGCCVGNMFWMKLYHLAAEKISARSIGEYSKKNMQPVSGRKNKGGQRLGEMETWSFIAYDFNEALIETLYAKSDDMVSKKKIFEQIIEMGHANLPKKRYSEIAKIAKTYLNSIGLDIK